MMKAIGGLKRLIGQQSPLIIITTRPNKFSEFKPEGGKYLTHFSHVIIDIFETERKITYTLRQHPSMPEKSVESYHSMHAKLRTSKDGSLDKWLKNTR